MTSPSIAEGLDNKLPSFFSDLKKQVGNELVYVYRAKITVLPRAYRNRIFFHFLVADDEHIGIVAGWDENGNILIVHCASGYNNVVITGKEGFISVARPDIFTQEALDGTA